MMSQTETAEEKERAAINQTPLQAQTVGRRHLSPVSQQTQPPLAGGYDLLYLWRRRSLKEKQ